MAISAVSQTNTVSGAEFKKRIDSSPQKKNLTVVYDAKNDRTTLASQRFVLGRQTMLQDSDSNTSPFSTTAPTWEAVVTTAFPGKDLKANTDQFAWRFNIYNQRFIIDGAELKVTADGQEMSFKPARAGRVNSNLDVGDGTFQMDRTQDSIKRDTGSISDSSKPAYLIFVLSRDEMDKILHASKVRIQLTKQYDVGLQKDLKGAAEAMLAMTKVT